MGMLQVGSTEYLTLVWSGGAQQPLIVHTGYHVLKLSVPIFLPYLRIKRLKAGSQNDRPYTYFFLFRRLIEIYRLILTYCFANTTFALFKIKTAFIYISDKWNRLSEIYMDCLILRYFLIILIRVFDRAVLYTGSTARAFVL
jgi:hypothetical protein